MAIDQRRGKENTKRQKCYHDDHAWRPRIESIWDFLFLFPFSILNVYLSRGSTARRLTCKDFYASNQKLKTYERKYPLSISYMMFDAKFCMIDYWFETQFVMEVMEGKRAHQLSTQPSRGSQQRTNLCQIDINLLPISHLVQRSPSCVIPFQIVRLSALPCLVSPSVSESLPVFNFAQIVDLSKLSLGFVKIDTWISLSLLHGWNCNVVFTWICQNWYLDLHVLAL